MERASEAIDPVGAAPYAARLTSIDRRDHLECR
jgi:hypothetical protein